MTSSLPTNPLHILVVEDNAGDFLLLKEGINLSGIPVADIQKPILNPMNYYRKNQTMTVTTLSGNE